MVIPIVDQGLCIGYGLCEQTCPAVFELHGEKSRVIDEDACDCEEAAESCPVDAITLEE